MNPNQDATCFRKLLFNFSIEQSGLNFFFHKTVLISDLLIKGQTKILKIWSDFGTELLLLLLLLFNAVYWVLFMFK